MNTGEPQQICFKRDDGSYIDIMYELKEEGVYTVCTDEMGDFLDVLYEPVFTLMMLPKRYFGDKESSRLEDILRENYWNYQEDYVL